MKLLTAEYEASFTRDELYMIAWALFGDLKASIEDHYNVLQQNKDGEHLFFEQESSKIQLMKETYACSGYLGIFESNMANIKHLFEQRRLERQKKGAKDGTA